MSHGASSGHRVGHSGRGDGVHKTRLSGICEHRHELRESISGHLFFTTLKSFEIPEPRVLRLDRLPNGRNRITTNEVIAKGRISPLIEYSLNERKRI